MKDNIIANVMHLSTILKRQWDVATVKIHIFLQIKILAKPAHKFAAYAIMRQIVLSADQQVSVLLMVYANAQEAHFSIQIQINVEAVAKS